MGRYLYIELSNALYLVDSCLDILKEQTIYNQYMLIHKITYYYTTNSPNNKYLRIR